MSAPPCERTVRPDGSARLVWHRPGVWLVEALVHPSRATQWRLLDVAAGSVRPITARGDSLFVREAP